MNINEALHFLKELYPNSKVSVTQSVFDHMDDSWFLHVDETVVFHETFEAALTRLISILEMENILFRDFSNSY